MSSRGDITDGDTESSRVSYRQAVGMLSETNVLLTAEIERKQELTQTIVREGIDAEVHDLKGLRNAATLSLARVTMKLGCVSATVGDHYPALVRCQNVLCLASYDCFWEDLRVGGNVRRGVFSFASTALQRMRREKLCRGVSYTPPPPPTCGSSPG